MFKLEEKEKNMNKLSTIEQKDKCLEQLLTLVKSSLCFGHVEDEEFADILADESVLVGLAELDEIALLFGPLDRSNQKARSDLNQVGSGRLSSRVQDVHERNVRVFALSRDGCVLLRATGLRQQRIAVASRFLARQRGQR